MKFEIQTYFARNFADLGCFGSKFGANSCRYDSCNKALLWFYQNKCKQIANFTQLFTVSSCQFMTRSDDDGGKVSPSKGAAWLLRPQLMMNRASSWLGEISFSSQLAREPHKYQPEADLERTQFALTGIIWPDFRFFIHGLSVNWREGDGFEVLWREIYQLWECGQTVNLTQSYLMQQNQYEYEWINRESLCRHWFLWRMYLHSSDNRPQLMFVRDAVVYKQFIEDNMISPSNGIWICFRLSERGGGALLLYWALEKLSTYLGQSRSRPTNLQCTSQHKSTNPSQKMSEEKQRFLSSKAWSNGRNLTEKCWFLRFLLNSIFMPSHHEQLPESQLSVKMHHKST